MRHSIVSTLLLTLAAALITGCATDFAPTPSTTAGSLGEIRGMIHGGQQAISGARVYVYETSITGYGGSGIAASTSNLSKSLLVASSGANPTTNDGTGKYYVTSGPFGTFSITGDYSCDANTQVYLFVTHGNPGLAAGTDNSAIGEMALLGPCPSQGGNLASAVPFVYVNEVSTVAAAYAIGGFATDATHIGSSGSTQALLGIANAFANAANIADINTGVARSTPKFTTGTVPQTRINSIANILASCINTTSSTSSNCTTLFNNTKSTGTSGTAATDTASAAINLVHYPAVSGTQISALYTLEAGVSAPFSPHLSSAPNDFTLAITYPVLTTPLSTSPSQLAIDSQGNIWCANGLDVTKVSPLGVKLSGTGFAINSPNGSSALAIDLSDRVWIVSGQDSVITALSSTGAKQSSSGYDLSSTFSFISGVAVDSTGNPWFSGYAANAEAIIKLSSSGSTAAGPFAGAVSSFGPALAIDSSNNVWVSSGTNAIEKFNASGSRLSGNGYSIIPGGYAQFLALDNSGNLWIPDYNNNAVIKANSSGVSQAVATGGGMSTPYGIAIDGAGTSWNANYAAAKHSISTVDSTGATRSPGNGYQTSGTNGTSGIAVDASGNVWAADLGSNLIEFMGLAAPVVTPISPAKLGTRP